MKLFIIIGLIPLFTLGQSDWQKVEPKEFMEVIREYEQSISTGENYSLETTYKVYNDYKDLLPVQSFEGQMSCKAGKELNVTQMGHLMIQDALMNLTIDTLAKQIVVQNPDPSFFYRKSLQDYTTFIELAEAVYKKDLGNRTFYMLQLKKGNPYSSMEFTFSEKNQISQVIIYSNQPYFVEDENYSLAKAKIVIDFTKFRKGKAVDFTHFMTVKNCVQIRDKQITPIGIYKDFELIDLRN